MAGGGWLVDILSAARRNIELLLANQRSRCDEQRPLVNGVGEFHKFVLEFAAKLHALGASPCRLRPIARSAGVVVRLAKSS